MSIEGELLNELRTAFRTFDSNNNDNGSDTSQLLHSTSSSVPLTYVLTGPEGCGKTSALRHVEQYLNNEAKGQQREQEGPAAAVAAVMRINYATLTRQVPPLIEHLHCRYLCSCTRRSSGDKSHEGSDPPIPRLILVDALDVQTKILIGGALGPTREQQQHHQKVSSLDDEDSQCSFCKANSKFNNNNNVRDGAAESLSLLERLQLLLLQVATLYGQQQEHATTANPRIVVLVALRHENNLPIWFKKTFPVYRRKAMTPTLSRKAALSLVTSTLLESSSSCFGKQGVEEEEEQNEQEFQDVSSASLRRNKPTTSRRYVLEEGMLFGTSHQEASVAAAMEGKLTSMTRKDLAIAASLAPFLPPPPHTTIPSSLGPKFTTALQLVNDTKENEGEEYVVCSLDTPAASSTAAAIKDNKSTTQAISSSSPSSSLFGLEHIEAKLRQQITLFLLKSMRRGNTTYSITEHDIFHHQRRTGDGKRNETSGGGLLADAVDATTGILLHGASGCGKSALIAHLASVVFPTVPFFFVTAGRLFSKYLGESEVRLRHVFALAEQRRPSIVVIDDVDMIGSSRQKSPSSSGDGAGSGSKATADVNVRMLSALLCLMDGLSGSSSNNSGVLVIATTSRPSALDKALVRQGRFETTLFAPIPNREGLERHASAMLDKLLLSMTVAKGSVPSSEECEEKNYEGSSSNKDKCEIVKYLCDTCLGTSPATLQAIFREVLVSCRARSGTAPSPPQPPRVVTQCVVQEIVEESIKRGVVTLLRPSYADEKF